MFNRLLDKLQGADVFMVASFLIFVVFFIVVAVYLIKSNKDHIKRMSELPFNNDDNK
jgi:hypothetical protein